MSKIVEAHWANLSRHSLEVTGGAGDDGGEGLALAGGEVSGQVFVNGQDCICVRLHVGGGDADGAGAEIYIGPFEIADVLAAEAGIQGQ